MLRRLRTRKASRPTLSSSTEDGDRLFVGKIGKPHGLAGEATVLPDTDDPARFFVGSVLVTDTGRSLIVAEVKRYRDRGLLVRFEGIHGRTQAEELRGLSLMVGRAQRRQLGAGEFWPDDLIGLAAVAPDGETLGTVDRVEFGPGQDRLVVVTTDGVEVQVPFVSAMVGDPSGGSIEIDAPEGLFT